MIYLYIREHNTNIENHLFEDIIQNCIIFRYDLTERFQYEILCLCELKFIFCFLPQEINIMPSNKWKGEDIQIDYLIQKLLYSAKDRGATFNDII